MDKKTPELDSLFVAALEIDTPDERSAFLDQSCGEDQQLRDQVEQLLKSHGEAGSFLEQPAAGVDRTIDFDPEVLKAGLSASFGADAAVVIGNTGHSVLKSLGKNLPSVPQVMLREADGEDGPIARPRSDEVPRSDSRYQLLGEIARGGMGAILKGRDMDLGRDLAIKVLLDAHKSRPEMVQRFLEEAQIGGQLQHPGIAPVYELGQFADQRPFFSMKLVKGKTLSVLLSERQDPADERSRFLGIFEQICQTMAYAHSRGVIHRDLKPANIMVGAFGEVQVMDWGLAKVLGQGGIVDEKKTHAARQGVSVIQTVRSSGSDTPAGFGSHTQMGSVMGTPAYMAPEQALGEIDRLDERADVFGLGAILCEILTGHPPYVAPDDTQVFRLASRGKLDDCFVRLEESGVDAELLAVVRDCLAVEPDERLRNAGLLSERVTSYLQSVENRLHQAELDRIATNTKMIEERKRRRVMMVAAAMIVLLLIGGVAGTSVGLVSSWRNAAKLDLALDDANEQVYLVRLANADRAIEEKDYHRARFELRRCPEARRGWEWSFLQRRVDATVPLVLSGVGNPIYTSDGNRLIAIGVPGSAHENKARIWDTSTGELIGELEHRSRLMSLALSPDGKQLVGGDTHGTLTLWDIETTRSLWTVTEHEKRFEGLAISPDGSLIATANWDGTVKVFEAASGAVRFSLTFSRPQVRKVMFSPDGRWIAAGTSPPVLVNVSTGKIAGRFPQGTKVPTFSPDGRWIAAGNENEIVLWKWDGEELIQERSWKSTDTASFWDFRFGADGAHLASVQEASVQGGQRVKVWDVATGDELASQLGVQAYWLAMHPTRRQVAVPSNNGRIRLWNYAGRDDGLTTVPLAVGNRGKFSPDGRWIAVASGGLVSLLEAGSGKVLNTIEGHLTSAPWLPDSRHIVVSRKPENTLELRDAMTGELLRSFPGQSAGKVSSYVSQDGLNVTSVADFRDKVIRVWDVQSGRLKSEFRLQDVGWFGSEHIAVWGTRVAIGYDSRIEFWDTETASRTRTLPMPGRNYFIMVFSRDGERLFAGSNGGVLTLHDITTGQELKRFIGHRRIANLALSPDETQLLARDSLGRVIVWDVESAQPLISPSDAGESNLVWRTAGGSELDWSPDNQRILVGTSDGLQIWTLPHSGS